MLHVAPGMTASVPAIVIPKRRGLHRLGAYQVATSFPFGFVKRAVIHRHKDVILIYPPAARVDPRLLATCRSNDITGESARPAPGGADEFYGVKEYRTGDNPRWIYWRRSARSGTLVSKEMTQMSPPRILLLVDTCVPSQSLEERAAVERCIAMAASLATVALEQGLSVGLCVWSHEWITVAPTRGKRHRDDLLSLLSRLPLNTGHGATELMDHCQSVLHAGTTPIAFTPRDTPMRPVSGGRDRMLVISAGSARANDWFRFDPAIDFTTCMPVQGKETRGHGDAETRGGESRNPAIAIDSFSVSPRLPVPASPSSASLSSTP
jgi:uncharacterized protein (DUF58 family)